jgi:hypothetical protein
MNDHPPDSPRSAPSEAGALAATWRAVRAGWRFLRERLPWPRLRRGAERRDIHLQDYLAPVATEFDVDEILAVWRWLVPQRVTPLAITAFGDLFLLDASGAVLFLDTIDGKCDEVAASVEDWGTTIRQRPELFDQWFMPAFLGQLRAAGQHLSQGQCYSARHSIVLGGAYTPENWEPTFWEVHFACAGLLHEQLKDLPPGTIITKITFPRL